MFWGVPSLGIFELILLAVSLSMDAFAVSVCKGLSIHEPSLRHYLTVGTWFGGFQALMPSLGYLLGSAFAKIMERYSAWIAFGLLVVIGANMIRESLSGREKDTDASLAPGGMLLLAVATSIDAFAVGVTFAALGQSNVIACVLFIGCVTFGISAGGLKIGSIFGTRYQKHAQLTGGIVLILLGIKILLEHFGLWFH